MRAKLKEIAGKEIWLCTLSLLACGNQLRGRVAQLSFASDLCMVFCIATESHKCVSLVTEVVLPSRTWLPQHTNEPIALRLPTDLKVTEATCRAQRQVLGFFFCSQGIFWPRVGLSPQVQHIPKHTPTPLHAKNSLLDSTLNTNKSYTSSAVFGRVTNR